MTAAFFNIGVLRDESGAVTVDWVVLTAAIVVLGALVLAVFGPSLLSSATEIGDIVRSSTL